MLNWATRYFPILRVLEEHLPKDGRILELGSGAVGLSFLCKRPFVGCDIKFDSHPALSMRPVICSAASLPFSDRVFEAAVVSDVLEHIPPIDRPRVIQEALRVTSRVAIFGFPFGSEAAALDRRFYAYHQAKGISPPDWLKEHMLYPYPDKDLFQGLEAAWRIESFGNEYVRFHEWVNQRELFGPWNVLFDALLKVCPSVMEWLLRFADREPCYRTIFVLVRYESKVTTSVQRHVEHRHSNVQS